MSNPAQTNDNNFFQLACLASVIAGATLAVIALASAAPVGFALSTGLSVAVGGMLLSTVIRFCCGCVGAGWGSGAGVVVVDSSPGYWNRFSNWCSRPLFSGWGNGGDSNYVSNPRNFHGHQSTRPVPAYENRLPDVSPPSRVGFFDSLGSSRRHGHSAPAAPSLGGYLSR